MRNKMRFAGKLVGAGALTALLATAAVAAPAPRNGARQDSGHMSEQRAAGGEQQWRPARRSPQAARQSDVLQVRVDIGRPGNYGYGYGNQQQGILRGVVSRINSRNGTMTVRDQATGRFVTIDMQQMSGRGLRGLRRGDFVTVSGQWERGNAFAAYRITSGGRY